MERNTVCCCVDELLQPVNAILTAVRYGPITEGGIAAVNTLLFCNESKPIRTPSKFKLGFASLFEGGK